MYKVKFCYTPAQAERILARIGKRCGNNENWLMSIGIFLIPNSVADPNSRSRESITCMFEAIFGAMKLFCSPRTEAIILMSKNQ